MIAMLTGAGISTDSGFPDYRARTLEPLYEEVVGVFERVVIDAGVELDMLEATDVGASTNSSILATVATPCGRRAGGRICGMEFAEVIRRRRMVRHYADRSLTPEAIEKILASALRAPSAGFSQGWAFLALTDAADRARFWPFVPTRVAQTPTMQDAPLVVVPLAHKAAYLSRYAEADKGWTDRSEARWPAPYWYIDTGMATLMMLLTAIDEGLGACFFGIMPARGEDFDPAVHVPAHTAAFKAEFAIPDEYTPIGGICIGYRADDLPPQTSAVAQRRRSPDAVIHRGQWGRRH